MITFEADAMCGTTTAFFSSASPGFMKGSSCGGFGEPSSSEQSSFDFFFFFLQKNSNLAESNITSNTSRPTRNMGFAFRCSTRAASSITGPLLAFTRIASCKQRVLLHQCCGRRRFIAICSFFYVIIVPWMTEKIGQK